MATAVSGVERKPFKYFEIAFLGYNAKLTNVPDKFQVLKYEDIR